MKKSKPFVVEFAGLPAAGKTTAANILLGELVRHGYRCVLIPEAASQFPVPKLKRSWKMNAWSLCQTVSSLIEATARNECDVVIVDRGLVDALSWIQWYRQAGRIPPAVAEALECFTRIPAWFQSEAFVLFLRVSFKTAVQRRGGATGRIVNTRTFEELNNAYDKVVQGRPVQNLITKDTDRLLPTEVVQPILLHLLPKLEAATRTEP